MGSENTYAEKSAYNKTSREHIGAAHLKAQKRTAMITGPILILVTGIVSYTDPHWQYFVVLGTIVFVELLFLWFIKMSKGGKYELASALTMIAVLFFTTLSNALIHDLLEIAVLAYLATIFHASLYSRKSLNIGIVLVVMSFVGVLLIQFFQPFELMKLSDSASVFVVLILAVMMMGQTYAYMKQAYDLNMFIFHRLESSGAKQKNAIDSIKNMQPIIRGAVGRIRTISSGFASQAGEQAAATSEVSATVVEAMTTSEQTVRTAKKTQGIAQATREGLLKHSSNLKLVEQGFENVVRRIDTSRDQILSLATKVEQIEEILNTNKAIGGHIKVLAVNAAIEAAKAGEYGRGFKVVAAELRSMINSTDTNLVSSHELLEEIREKSREASGAIGIGRDALLKYFAELRDIGQTIEDTVESFVQTSRHVQQISVATEEQRVGMSEMSSTMEQLETAAGLLTASAGTLSESVDKIMLTQKQLSSALRGE